MKKCLLFLSLFLGSLCNTYAADLIEVYQQALISDQIFQQAIAQSYSDKEGVPISVSALLPSLSALAAPNISQSSSSGPGTAFAGTNTQRGYNYSLTLKQTLFDFGKFSNFLGARALSKRATATLNAASQELMVRVTKAYLAVLNSEDSVSYTVASRNAYAKQLDQVKQQFKVGLKTITDVYTAQASYSSSDAAYIAALNQLEINRENLRVITGILYPTLAKLREDIPLVSPEPENIEKWVDVAQRQNWAIRAAQYAVVAARQNVKQQFAGNLPTIQAQAGYDVDFNRTITSDPAGSVISGANQTIAFKGAAQTATTGAGITLNIPLVQGGYVVASTRKAQFDFKVATNQLEQQIRTTVNVTRQSFTSILADIRKIAADKEAITSTISSLEGLRAAYDVGTGTLVDVVNQQQRVVQAQEQYARDRYSYVNNFMALKAAAGTLSYSDMMALNSWLKETEGKHYPKLSDKNHHYNTAPKQSKYL